MTARRILRATIAAIPVVLMAIGAAAVLAGIGLGMILTTTRRRRRTVT